MTANPLGGFFHHPRDRRRHAVGQKLFGVDAVKVLVFPNVAFLTVRKEDGDRSLVSQAGTGIQFKLVEREVSPPHIAANGVQDGRNERNDRHGVSGDGPTFPKDNTKLAGQVC